MYREISLYDDGREYVAVDETDRATGETAAEALRKFAESIAGDADPLLGMGMETLAEVQRELPDATRGAPDCPSCGLAMFGAATEDGPFCPNCEAGE